MQTSSSAGVSDAYGFVGCQQSQLWEMASDGQSGAPQAARTSLGDCL